MYKQLLKTLRLRLCMLVALLCTLSLSAWGENVTYTVTSTSAVSTSGTAPTGSSATYSSTYSTKYQLTSGNSMELTLNGYNGYKITNITLSMKSNSSDGAGTLSYSVDGGTNYSYIVGSASSNVKFNNNAWHGSWSTSYVNVSKDVEITPTSSTLKIKIAASTNSLYCQSFKITYAKPLSSISLSGTYPTSFYTGDEFSHEGMTVTANYEGGTTKDVTSNATFTGYDMSTTGTQKVTVSYTEGGITKTSGYNIEVNERPIFSVTLSGGETLTEESAGAGVTLPSRPGIGDYDFVGWSTTDVTTETSTSPTTIPAGLYKPSGNITLYPIYSRSEKSGDPVETKSQTLQYDSWSYTTANTKDKSSYRMFGKGGYVESDVFDLSTLSKVIVYGGTFGGNEYNSLTIGDGTNTWRNVTVSGNKETGTNTYTSEGATPLSGYGKLRITSNSGDAEDYGVRISKIEIFTLVTPTTYYYTGHPSGKETPLWAFSPATLETLYVGESDATFTIETNYDGTLTASTSDASVATITKTTAKSFTVHAVAKGDVIFTISGDETDNYKSVSKTIAANVLQKYTVTIETPTNGTLVIKNGGEAVSTGDKFLPGTVLTAEVTPNEDYNFRNWQAVDASTHTYTSAYTYTMGEHDVTFKANFDAKVYHTVRWSVNGNIISSEPKTEEGANITFTDPDAESIPDGYAFIGWSATEILSPQTAAPSCVTDATMGTADVTYYAVLAVDNSTPVVEHTSTFTIKQASAPSSPYVSEDVNWTWSNVSFVNGDNNACINSSNGSVSFTLPSGGTAKSLKITKTTNIWASAAQVVLKNAENATLKTFSLGSNTSDTYNFTSTNNHSSTYTLSNSTSKNAWIDNIQFTYETGGADFSGYCTTTPPVELTITLNAACTDGEMIYGTYSSSLPFIVSDDIIVSEIAIVDDKLYVEPYKTGDVVPANTGVMVSALEGGNYTILVASTEGSSVLGEENRLRPTGDAGITAEAMGTADANCLYYRLTMHNGTTIGYWWGAEDGAAFNMGANKAYLAISEVQAARMMGFGFDGINTAISSINSTIDISAPVYNVLGQRVAPTTKGILIQNGKKYINK